MSRLRTIKPEFFTSTQVVEVSIPARLAFIGMWCFSDDGGVHPADPKRLRLEVFPADDCRMADVNKWIDELLCVGLIEQYTANNSTWWRITGWERHQRIDQPTHRYPLPDGTIPANGRRRPPQGSDSTNVQRTITERSLWNGTERNGVDTDTVRPFDASDHFEVWPEARRRAAETAKRLWPSGRPQPSTEPDRAKREMDNAMLLRIAFLSCALFTDGWIADAVTGTTVDTNTRKQKPIRNRLGYFKSILAKSAKTRGYNLNALLDSVEIPKRPPKGADGSENILVSDKVPKGE